MFLWLRRKIDDESCVSLFELGKQKTVRLQMCLSCGMIFHNTYGRQRSEFVTPHCVSGLLLSTSVHTYNYTSWAPSSHVILLTESQVSLVRSTMACLVNVLTWATHRPI